LVHLSQTGVRTAQVYHPNIDLEGHVCLNILRADWMPVLSLGSVIFGLMTLFLVRLFFSQCLSLPRENFKFFLSHLLPLQEPNPDDPLNKEAAQLMIDRPRDFERNVKQALQGGYVAGKQFPRLLK
jgi:ubiquitin-conjugating enzyme E2 M